MKNNEAIDALSALAHDARLDAFRALVRAGEDGAPAGDVAEAVGVSRPIMSFHLKQLEAAGLVWAEKRGRERVYRADYARMRALLSFLSEDCCVGLQVRERADGAA